MVYFFRILEGNDLDWFELDSATGIITTKRYLDYEIVANRTLQLVVMAQDESASPLSNSTSVFIRITAENDNAPIFENNFYDVSVQRSPLPVDVARVIATDADIGGTNNVDYSIFAVRPLTKSCGSLVPHFSINQEGVVALESVPNSASTMVRYEVVVMAVDDGEKPLSSTTIIHVTVTSNQNPLPVFYPKDYYVHISAGFYSDFTIVTLMAGLPDQSESEIRYSILTGDGGFDIDPASGRLFVTSRNFPSNSLFMVQINARSSVGDSVTPATAHIFVDKSDIIFFNQLEHYNQVLENVEPLSQLGQVVASSVVSNANITYQITNGDKNQVFVINGNTGNISISSETKLNFEGEKSYNLTVIATLHNMEGSLISFSSCEVVVTVIDVNDNFPLLLNSRKVNETESDSCAYFEDLITFQHPGDLSYIGNTLYNASAIDYDSGLNGQISFFIEDALNALDILDNGLVIIKRPFPNLPSNYVDDVTITSCDNGSPRLCTRLRLRIQVDAWISSTAIPSSVISNLNAQVLESAPAGTKIINLSRFLSEEYSNPTAINDSGDLVTVVTYYIANGNPGDVFGVFPEGQVFLKRADLDRERCSYYCITINITIYQNNLVYTFNSTVRIWVLDANDNKPQFSSPEITFTISENAPRHTLIGHILADDPDTGSFSSLVYEIAEGFDQTSHANPLPFVVNRYTGAITTTSVIDLESLRNLWGDWLLGPDTFSFRVTVKDNDGQDVFSTLGNDVVVKIQILDQNEHSPAFSRSLYLAEVTEDAATSAEVIQLSAFDKDKNSTLRYQIPSQNMDVPFRIDSSTGLISVSQDLNRETVSDYRFVASVSDDDGFVSFTSTCTVQVKVFDLNDSPPQLDVATLHWNVSENARLYQTIGRVRAVDADEKGSNNIVKFTLSTENTGIVQQTFSIDESSGNMILIDALDREVQSSYDLVVEVSDSGTDTWHTSTATVRVAIMDVNDNTPRLAPPKTFRVLEDTYSTPIFVGELSAVDEDINDNARLSFNIIKQTPQSPDIQITLVENTGRLYLAGSLDREKFPDSKLSLVVQVNDNPAEETDQLWSQDVVEIIIEDVNDNSPLLSSPDTVFIPTSAADMISYQVATLMFYDPDNGDNGTVRFTDAIYNQSEFFKIQPETGILELYNPLLRDHSVVFTVNVVAFDRGELKFMVIALLLK